MKDTTRRAEDTEDATKRELPMIFFLMVKKTAEGHILLPICVNHQDQDWQGLMMGDLLFRSL